MSVYYIYAYIAIYVRFIIGWRLIDQPRWSNHGDFDERKL